MWRRYDDIQRCDKVHRCSSLGRSKRERRRVTLAMNKRNLWRLGLYNLRSWLRFSPIETS